VYMMYMCVHGWLTGTQSFDVDAYKSAQSTQTLPPDREMFSLSTS